MCFSSRRGRTSRLGATINYILLYKCYSRVLRNQSNTGQNQSNTARPLRGLSIKSLKNNILGRFAANLSKKLSKNLSKVTWRYEVTLGGSTALGCCRFLCSISAHENRSADTRARSLCLKRLSSIFGALGTPAKPNRDAGTCRATRSYANILLY